MSLLTRTKGYFVVICVLMCGFLLTFSWRLLYGTYDSQTLVKPSQKVPHLLRQLENIPINPTLSRSYVVKLSDDEISVKVKGQNGTKPFTKDEIGSILSKIHELGLSASEFQEKLLVWQQQQNLKNMSSVFSRHQGIPTPSIKTIVKNLFASDQYKVPSPKASHHGNSDANNNFRVSKHPANGDRDNDVIPNLPSEQDPVIDNNINTDPDIHDNNLPDDKEKDESHNGVRRTETESNEVKPNLKDSAETFGKQKDATSHTQQNRKQREKYLQFLKEKFELSKTRNASDEIKDKNTSPSVSNKANTDNKTVRLTHGNMEKDTTPTTYNFTKKMTLFPDRSTISLFQKMRQKYPTFAEQLAKDSNTPEIQGTQRPDYCRGCFDFNFPTLIDHPQLCKNSKAGGSQSVFLLMLISSAPGNYHARTVIRQTWGAKCGETKTDSELKCLFVIGVSKSQSENSQVQLENDHHQDILQIGFKDSYSNLTYKTVSSFKWATQNCFSAKYVMKTDDDMFINTELIPMMLQAAPSRKFMGGFCWGSSSPNRDVSSKWFVSLKSFHKPKFPPMCSGTGYIMSMDVLRSMLFASRNVPFFHLEDVYVALCLQKYGILPVNIMGFSNMFQEFGACHYKNAVMTSHQVPPELLEEFWTSMNKCPKSNISPAQLYIVMPFPAVD